MSGSTGWETPFALDVPATVARLEAFIRDRMAGWGRVGVVVPLSGGLDSSAVAALCARAVGPERVVALLLPDRRGARDALRFGRLVADRLGVRAVEIDATRLNRAAGVYDFVGYRLPPRLVAAVARRRLGRSGRNVFVEGLRGSGRRLTREALAAINARQRLRLVVTYRYAERNRLLVVGAAHLTEDLLGLFVKFGVDDCADVMPFKDLYRTQVLALARALDVPAEVLARTPNPEMLPGVDDKYRDVFGVPAATVDLVLWGFRIGAVDEEIARRTGVDRVTVADLREAVRLSAHMRDGSQRPELTSLRPTPGPPASAGG